MHFHDRLDSTRILVIDTLYTPFPPVFLLFFHTYLLVCRGFLCSQSYILSRFLDPLRQFFSMFFISLGSHFFVSVSSTSPLLYCLPLASLANVRWVFLGHLQIRDTSTGTYLALLGLRSCCLFLRLLHRSYEDNSFNPFRWDKDFVLDICTINSKTTRTAAHCIHHVLNRVAYWNTAHIYHSQSMNGYPVLT
ncbi:hypothetical protein BJX68DRAFT_59524 [Aspergillus pseudodeflectus]|uniref:Fatty acid desaturase domain-containing protein n=1 Tax=Aspergillus pseudodeflectus TaxID=176178 RepID=A0ABR4KJE6_9EURO